MKTKLTKICRREGCNNEFKLYKTTDRYCSAYCAYNDNANKPISKQSDKLKHKLAIYAKLRKIFLAKPENKYCPVASTIFNEVELATEIHHKKGRIGELLLYVPFWLAVSRKGHNWIHANPKLAYEMGVLIRSTIVNI